MDRITPFGKMVGACRFHHDISGIRAAPGGRWHFIMHGPDKGSYANECVFIKVERPVMVAWYRRTKPLFTVVATFEELITGRTRIVYQMLFPNAAECNKVRAFAPEKNEEKLDRLEAELMHMLQSG